MAATKNGKMTAKNRIADVPTEVVRVTSPRMKTIKLRLVGLSPYLQLKFSEKSRNKMMETQAAGQQARSKKVREARDFDADYEGATHYTADGKCGIPAAAFRNACISACRLVGFQMTKAKLSIFVEHDGLDSTDGTPLVFIRGERERTIMPARNANGNCDMRVRPMWREWECELRVRFDEDQFSVADLVNLLVRAGCQVGVGEGRPDSPKSNGQGFGMFAVEFAEEA